MFLIYTKIVSAMWRTYIIRFTGILYPEPTHYRPEMIIFVLTESIAALGDLCPSNTLRISNFILFLGGGGGRGMFDGLGGCFTIFQLFLFVFISSWPRGLTKSIILCSISSEFSLAFGENMQ